jgi:Cu/Ag efflux protein CusF
MRGPRRVTLLLGLALAAAACHRRPQLPLQHYRLRGVVVSVDAGARRMVVNHDEIPGFMAAMTMPYAVKDRAALELIQPRDTITADVVVQGMDVWLEHVVRQSGGGHTP